MKVGITTIFAVPNYGAMLQSYALCSHLKRTGHDAEIIDYRQPALEKLYRFKPSFPPALKHWLRLRRCSDFVSHQIPRSARRYDSIDGPLRELDYYDVLITGSDQVWFTGPVQYYDPIFFLDLPACNARKISYAASAGGSISFDPFTERARQALGRFSHIGVRDSHTAALVKPLTPAPPTETVDPTFLIDFAELTFGRSPESEPYIVVFGNFSANPAVIEEVRRSTGIQKVVSLQYPCPGATRRIASPSPVDWLHWIRHSAFVITSYFHGTAFAVHYQRPFIAIPTPGRVFKVKTLLQPLGLSSRSVERASQGDFGRIAVESIDWATAQDTLDKQIQQSTAFLRSALS